MFIAVQTKLSWNEIFIKRVLVHQYILCYCLLATVQHLSKENGNTWSNNNVERRAQTFASFSTALFKMLQPFTLDVLTKQSSMSVRILVKKCSHLITQKNQHFRQCFRWHSTILTDRMLFVWHIFNVSWLSEKYVSPAIHKRKTAL